MFQQNRQDQSLRVISFSDVSRDRQIQESQEGAEILNQGKTDNRPESSNSIQLPQVEGCPECSLTCQGCVVAALIHDQKKGRRASPQMSEDPQVSPPSPKKDFSVVLQINNKSTK